MLIELCKEQFGSLVYEVAEKTRSELYLELLPAVNNGRVVLLDDQRLVRQLVGLERRVARSGRESVDHAPGSHDDCANVLAGVTAIRAQKFFMPQVIEVFRDPHEGHDMNNPFDFDRFWHKQ